MSVKCKDIAGLMVEKKEPEPHQGIGRPDGWNNFRIEGFNQAIDLQSQRTVSIDRVKTVRVLQAIDDEVEYRFRTNHPCVGQWTNHPEDILRFKQEVLNDCLSKLLISGKE